MKRFCLVCAVVFALVFALAGCVIQVQTGTTTPPETTVPAAPEAEKTAVLHAVFGFPDGISAYETAYTGELTPEILMNGLSEATGLAFAGTAAVVPEGIVVSWSGESALLTGRAGQTAKAEFQIEDTQNLRWFMMDSLWSTFQENFGEINVFYVEEGKDELHLPGGPEVTLNRETPYMGTGGQQ